MNQLTFETRPSGPSLNGGLVVAIVLAGAALRLPGLRTELWFDEIVSVQSVARLGSLGRVLWADHTDNKHHLIWAWIWLAGPGRAAWAYRLPSFMAGVALPPLLYAVVRRPFGTAAGLRAAVLATFCYPLIFYSSEARGYALAALAGVAAFGMAPSRLAGPPAGRDPGRQARRLTRPLLFGACVVAGFLSHLTFAYVYAGLLAWGLVDAVRRPRWATTLAAYHGPAVAVLSAVWWFDASRMRYAGGPPTAAVTVLRYLAAMTVGTPPTGPLPWVAVAAAVALCVAGLVAVGRRLGAGPVAFFIVALVVAPVALTVTRRTPYLAVRYYLVDLPFVLMLASAAVVPRVGRWVTIVVTAAVAVQGVLGAWQLNGLGRGHVREALAHMAAGGAGPVTYASKRPAMDHVNVDYYAPAVPGRPAFVDLSATGQPPQWWIWDWDDPLLRGPDAWAWRGRPYRLDAVYPSDPTSGLTWDLYRRVDP